jgi:hypothetical protein
MIIQTIGLDPFGAVWTDETSNLSRLDPSGAIQIDAEHPSRNRKVVGSSASPTRPSLGGWDHAAHAGMPHPRPG